jgi:squalene-hopene/tetraprenyl-beta-curcumene cyclase
MRITRAGGLALAILAPVLLVSCSSSPENQDLPLVRSNIDPSWDQKAATSYLDHRAAWWADWTTAARDHHTFCVSCHTTVPYILARAALRRELEESTPSAEETVILQNVRKRVGHWKEVDPYYQDSDYDKRIGTESRATESVLNALILASFDFETRQLSDETTVAFSNMWELQKTEAGDQQGAWDWHQFDLRPWEASNSPYWGAILAAVAVGKAPSDYASSPNIQTNLSLLRNYLTRNYSGQSLLNRVMLLWASGHLPGLLQQDERQRIIKEAFREQNADGGWTLSSVDWTWRSRSMFSFVSIWKRDDWSPQDRESDGCATGIFLFSLEEAGVGAENPQLRKGLSWLIHNQSKFDGSWTASSLNKHRDPRSNIGLFMSDAATGFAVLALTEDRPPGRTAAAAVELKPNSGKKLSR